MIEAYKIHDPRVIANMAATASASGYGHIVPILEAVRSNLIQLVVLDRQTRLPRALQHNRIDKPTVLLLGDDDYQSIGPSGWKCAEAARDWAKRAYIHGCGGTPEEYRRAVYHAVEAKRLVFVETSSSHLDAWLQFFSEAAKPVQIDLFKARDGQHPKPVPRSEMQ